MTVIINGTSGITSVNGSAAAPSVTGTDTDTGIVYGTNTLSLATGGTTAVTLDSSQNVLVGTTAPINSEKVAIWTAATVGIKPGLVINNPYGYGSGVGTAGTSLTFARSRVTGEYYPSGQIVSGNEAETTSATTYMSFYTTNSGGTSTERARFNSGGTFVLAGGNTSASGVGIAFPATQSASSDANTLDDYEEGTFTPEIKCTSVNGTRTYLYQNGYYVKVGKLVWVFFDMNISSWSGASGAAYVDFPFVNGNLVQNYSSFLAWDVSQTFTGTNVQVAGYISTNGIDMRLYKYTGTSNEVASGININTTGRISGVMTYRAES